MLRGKYIHVIVASEVGLTRNVIGEVTTSGSEKRKVSTGTVSGDAQCQFSIPKKITERKQYMAPRYFQC